MRWPGFPNSSRSFNLVVWAVAVVLVVFWVFKIRNIRRLKFEAARLEAKLKKGQDLWKAYPPLTLGERRDLQKAQERLFSILPKDRDIPPLLQEVSRLAREYNLVNVSIQTGDRAALSASQAAAPSSRVAAVPQPTPAVATGPQGSSGPIASFPVKLSFAGDYREIAYFLGALEKIPRLVTIQSVRLKRSVPLVAAEVVIKAYYLSGGVSLETK